jgi:hypothetical protein
MEDKDVSRKQKCSRLRASQFYQQNTELTVGKSTHSLVIQLEARSLWFCVTKPDILRDMRFIWQWLCRFVFWDKIPGYFGRQAPNCTVSYHREINFQYPVTVFGAASNELSLLTLKTPN